MFQKSNRISPILKQIFQCCSRAKSRDDMSTQLCCSFLCSISCCGGIMCFCRSTSRRCTFSSMSTSVLTLTLSARTNNARTNTKAMICKRWERGAQWGWEGAGPGAAWPCAQVGAVGTRELGGSRDRGQRWQGQFQALPVVLPQGPVFAPHPSSSPTFPCCCTHHWPRSKMQQRCLPVALNPSPAL